jgi:hypothetical protein
MDYRKKRTIARSWSKIRKYEKTDAGPTKLLFMSGEDTLYKCWRFEQRYQKLDGFYLHHKWAAGEGDVVRHLCGEGKCVNPLHLIRGTDIENAVDEIDVRDFAIDWMEKELDDYSLEGLENDIKFRVLVPRMRLRYKDKYDTLEDVRSTAREFYRQKYERYIVNEGKFIQEQMDYAKRLMEILNSRDDVSIVVI